MTRSAEFATTIKRGIRCAQPDLVVHASLGNGEPDGPRIGFVVSKAVGNAVDRHRVTRRLRHAARAAVPVLNTSDRVVIRALPNSRDAGFAQLELQLLTGIRHARKTGGAT